MRKLWNCQRLRLWETEWMWRTQQEHRGGHQDASVTQADQLFLSIIRPFIYFLFFCSSSRLFFFYLLLSFYWKTRHINSIKLEKEEKKIIKLRNSIYPSVDNGGNKKIKDILIRVATQGWSLEREIWNPNFTNSIKLNASKHLHNERHDAHAELHTLRHLYISTFTYPFHIPLSFSLSLYPFTRSFLSSTPTHKCTVFSLYIYIF